MSGLLYCLYTNEVPRLHELLSDNIFSKMTNTDCHKFTNINHDTYNFVDDSTCIISFPDTRQIKSYLTNMYLLLHSYYTINKLKINSDKTKLMIGYKNKHREEIQNFHFMAKNDKIVNTNSIKILGFTLRYDNNLDTQIGNTCANLHYRLNLIRKITKFSQFKDRLVMVKSLVIGKLLYAMPIYTQATEAQIAKIHKVIMTASRVIIGSYCFKKSTTYILDKCGLLSAKQMIAYSSITYLNKIYFNNKPTSIYELFIPINRRGTDLKIRTKLRAKTKKFKNHIINKGSEMVNSIPSEIKNLPPKTFKKQLKKYLHTHNMWEPDDLDIMT